jgi:hypothetical protein
MKTIRSIAWPQDHLRRASDAIAEQLRLGAPFDVLKIARVSCEAAVRNDVDLEELSRHRPPAFVKKSQPETV